MEKGKLKRFKVTQSMRFGSTGAKILFYAGVMLEILCLLVIVGSFVLHTKKLLGAGVIFAVIAGIWIFAVRLMSESNFGLAQIAFHEGGMVYRATGAKDATEYLLRWEDVKAAGIVKVRFSYWVYMSDHELEPKEKQDFPDHANDGVFYFNYADNTWEEFIKFAPDPYKTLLCEEKSRVIK